MYRNGMAANLNRSDSEGFKKCCISVSMNETDGGVFWNAVKLLSYVYTCCVTA